MAESKRRRVENYLTADGREPFEEWITSLRDTSGRAKVRVRLNRVMEGNLGDCNSVGDGVHELRIDFGPGYRVYFGVDGDLVVVLCGGNKRTQSSDIATAKQYWSDYNA